MRNSSFGALAVLFLVMVALVLILVPSERHSVSSTPGPFWSSRP